MSQPNSSSFTTSQVEALQHHIRLFKALSQRYIESSIPKSLPEGYTPPPQVFQRPMYQTNSSSHGNQGYSNAASGRQSVPQQMSQSQSSQIQQLHANPSRLPSSTNGSNNSSNVQAKMAQVRGSSYQNPSHGSQSSGSLLSQSVMPQYNDHIIHQNNQQLFQQQSSFQPQMQQPSSHPQGPTLSWQCFNSILAIGPPKLPDGMISISPSVRLYISF